MNKSVFLFSSFLFLVSSLLFLIPPSFALEPINIGDTRHYYPNTSGDDQNYIPSDPKKVQTIPITKMINISQTFEPEIENPGGSAPPVYKYRDINKIEENVNTQELNTNFFRQNFFHFSQPLADPLDTPENIKSTFTSYTSPHNSTRRSFSAASQRCFISNQISEISTFIDGGNSICIDRQIDTSRGKIRIGEIVSALIKNGLGKLYYPDTKCPPDQEPEEFPSNVLSALNKANYHYSLSLEEYQRLYLYGIEPICTNSLAQVVEHCDLDDQGNQTSCTEEIRSEPLASATSNENLYRNYLPASVDNSSTDYSQTQVTPPNVDTPNPLSWLAQFFKNFFQGRLSDTVTYSGPHSVTTKIDVRQATALQAHESTLVNFFPASSKIDTEIENTASSGTNEVTLDPGNKNSLLEKKFYYLTRPASWR